MALTKQNEEQVKKFLNHINKMVKYWAETDNTCDNKLRGLAFSFLVLLDGGDMDFNGFSLIENGTDVDISIGHLHEIMNKFEE